MTEPILVVTNLTKRFGGFVALDEVDVSLGGKERLGLIGPNGSGKTTLINCISGALFNEQGKVNFEGSDITGTVASNRAKLGIVRTFQIPRPFRSMTIIENLEIPMKYAASDRLGSGHLREQAMESLEVVGLQDRADENSANLTQIDMRRLELARALSAKPSLLLSDETMAGLSSSEVDEVLDILFALNERGVAVIMIEHIMRAVMKYSERIVVLDAGKKIADGSPDEIVNNRDVERAYLGE
jgi:branched-chain amino acid transport system ATP-binding protein